MGREAGRATLSPGRWCWATRGSAALVLKGRAVPWVNLPLLPAKCLHPPCDHAANSSLQLLSVTCRKRCGKVVVCVLNGVSWLRANTGEQSGSWCPTLLVLNTRSQVTQGPMYSLMNFTVGKFVILGFFKNAGTERNLAQRNLSTLISVALKPFWICPQPSFPDPAFLFSQACLCLDPPLSPPLGFAPQHLSPGRAFPLLCIVFCPSPPSGEWPLLICSNLNFASGWVGYPHFFAVIEEWFSVCKENHERCQGQYGGRLLCVSL